MQVIKAAAQATAAAAEVTLIRFGLLRLQAAADPPRTLVLRATQLATTARNKLKTCFKWVLFARSERRFLQEKRAVPQRDAQRFAWLDNQWLQDHLSGEDAECTAAVDLAAQALLGKGAPMELVEFSRGCLKSIKERKPHSESPYAL